MALTLKPIKGPRKSGPKGGRPVKLQVVEIDPDGIMPLDYMLAVVRDPTATQERRDRMAIASAPYCHPKVTEAPLGKKEQARIDAVAKPKNSDWGDLVTNTGEKNFPLNA